LRPLEIFFTPHRACSRTRTSVFTPYKAYLLAVTLIQRRWTGEVPDHSPARTPDFEELRFYLARLRRERHLTLEQLAERSGVGRRSLVQLESGESKGTLETWFKIAEGLDMEIGAVVSALYGPGRERR